ncbi:response regulator [Puniceicoccales bacterium CK1056]|uniref:histidine kinase n=1 Tax=Oceanipulchritudo coccoides TaxID=2706888 RepID=A0A6B2M2R0_9BACT|nr:hybrid sensor histidine kinase/response regulator [Oceanipulchritudo coccoides]NDV62404.1 response regulator [Oceanipulchritudo coccoides]
MIQDSKPVILAVDDAPANLDVLIGLLNDQYKVKVATSGDNALKLATAGSPPDLILLDILMPEMDGIEVCRALKEHRHLRDVPVIFISSLEEVDDKIKAFTTGGVDYVTKPFQPEELLARVNTHLTLRKVQKQLEEHNDHLDELVRRKSKELAEAHDRLELVARTKGEFLKLISHELRTPANGILGVAEVVIKSCAESEDVIALRPYFEESRDRMISVLDDSLLLAEVDFSQKDFKTVPVPLSEILAEAFRTSSGFAREQEVETGSMPFCNADVDGDAGLFKMSLTALAMTAVVFTDPGKSVSVRCIDGATTVTLVMESSGRILDEKTIEGFFDLSSSVRSSTQAEVLGLKPVVAERVISLYGGFVQLRNNDDKGIAINITMKKSLA